MGTLRSIVHSTRRHTLEVQSNINLLRSSCICIDEKSFHPRLLHLIKQIQSDLRSDDVSHLCQPVQLKTIDLDKDVNENIRSILGSNIKLYKTIIFRGTRYTTVTYQTRGQKDDSCVLYKMAKTTRAGFITSIIQANPDETNCVIQIRDALINQYLGIYLSGVQLGCSTAMFSNAN